MQKFVGYAKHNLHALTARHCLTRYLPIPMCSEGVLIGKRPFQDETMSEKTFLGHIANKFRRSFIFQLNIEGLTASKTNDLHYIALQFEALVKRVKKDTALHCLSFSKLVGTKHDNFVRWVSM